MRHGKNLGHYRTAMRSCETLAVLEGHEAAWATALTSTLRTFIGGDACSKPVPGVGIAVGVKRSLTSNERALVDAYLQGFVDAAVSVPVVERVDARLAAEAAGRDRRFDARHIRPEMEHFRPGPNHVEHHIPQRGPDEYAEPRRGLFEQGYVKSRRR